MNRYIKWFTLDTKDKVLEINFNVEPILTSIIIFGAIYTWMKV